jgi:hypothetical protein
VLGTNGDTNGIIRHTGVRTLLFTELLVGGGPRVNSQGFGVANTIRS